MIQASKIESRATRVLGTASSRFARINTLLLKVEVHLGGRLVIVDAIKSDRSLVHSPGPLERSTTLVALQGADRNAVNENSGGRAKRVPEGPEGGTNCTQAGV